MSHRIRTEDNKWLVERQEYGLWHIDWIAPSYMLARNWLKEMERANAL